MVKFDWLKFCNENRIEYETRSKNVARGHIAIRCPFCGSADPSQHMGLRLDVRNPFWGCLRNSRHRGANPVWLVQRLTGCSLDKARQIVTGNQSAYGDRMADEVKRTGLVPHSGLRSAQFFKPRLSMTESWHVGASEADEIESIRFPSEIKPIDGRGYSGRFLDYLESRGFSDPYMAVDLADLRYAVTGKFACRVIFPVIVGGKLVSYTGRDITGRSDIRYRTLPDDQASVTVKECLGFEDRVAAGGEILFLTEGPIDALKLNVYLQPDCAATCFYGMPERAQIAKVLLYAPRWRQIIVMLDPEATLQRLALWYALQVGHIRALQVTLPHGVADPGALSAAQVRHIGRSLLPR